jgi:hypothetical protein
MNIKAYHLSVIVFLSGVLQGCAEYPVLTIEQLKGSPVFVQPKKLAETPSQACLVTQLLRVPSSDYAKLSKESGILLDDLLSFRTTTSQKQLILSFRDVNPSCESYLVAGYPSKGHDVVTKTFRRENLSSKYAYLAGLVSTLKEKPPKGEMIKNPLAKQYFTKDGNPLTCDYDLMDMATAEGERITGESDEDLATRQALNTHLLWRGHPPEPVMRIMHGAQAEYSDYLRAIHFYEKPMLRENQPEAPLTALTHDGEVYRLRTLEDVLNFYRCHAIKIPAEWNIQMHY